MGLVVKEENKITAINSGVHEAICIGIIELGEQYSEKYNNKANKMMLVWELQDEKYKDDLGIERKRRTTREYTMSINEKSNLRKDLKIWLGYNISDEFDLKTLLGKGCLLQLEQKEQDGKSYLSIMAIMGLQKDRKLSTKTEYIVFDFDDEKTWGVYKTFSKKVKERISKAVNFTGKIKEALQE